MYLSVYEFRYVYYLSPPPPEKKVAVSYGEGKVFSSLRHDLHTLVNWRAMRIRTRAPIKALLTQTHTANAPGDHSEAINVS